jgi:hypothetical protein
VGARLAILLAVSSWLVSCGEDDAPTVPPGQATPAPAGGTPATAGSGSGKQLLPQVTIEDRVICLVESNPKKRCDPKAPKCEKSTDYCITNTDGSFCGPCKERDSIRHTFKPRDFVATAETRDPFQSFIITPPGIGSGAGAGSGDDKPPLDPAKNCTREDQMVAQSYSYQDLKLVGIVTQGTQRKVLMLDTTNLGHIIKRGDCVGKEKAVVKEIGKEFIMFEVHPVVAPGVAKREPEQRSVQLYPKQLPVSALPSEQQPPRGTAGGAPVVSPPPPPTESPPPPPTAGRAPAQGPTRIQIVQPPAQGPAVPPQAPTTLSP